MMANNHINELIATDELFQLIQKENFVGWVKGHHHSKT